MMEFVNGKDDIPFLLWKITLMFETTNQMIWVCLNMWPKQLNTSIFMGT
jgi:hypothetical protein